MPFKPLLVCTSIVALCASLSPAQAASGRTFVSGKGADSGACTVTAPCRSFAYALTQTAAFGEILVLDSAGYGTVSITQSVSIIAPPGIEGSISVPANGTGVNVSVGTNDRVVLQGLTIDGQNLASNNGVNAGGAGGFVKIAASHFRNLTGLSISITSSGITYDISNTDIVGTNSVNSRNTALDIELSRGIISNVDVQNATVGLFVYNSLTTMTNSTIANCRTGIDAYQNSVLQLGNTVVTQNSLAGINISQSTLNSYGDNDVNANNPDLSGGAITTISKK